MNARGSDGSRWPDAALAAALFAVDPAGIGGVALRSLPGPARDRWLEIARALFPDAPWRRAPLHVSDSRLLGGLDLAATLSAAQPVMDPGLLADAHRGVVVFPMAERLGAALAARVGWVLDRGETRLERDGFSRTRPARFGVILLDEGLDADEQAPSALLDRLAIRLDFSALGVADISEGAADLRVVEQARALLPRVEAGEEVATALAGVALELGIASLRAPLLALAVARRAAALAQRTLVSPEDCEVAIRLVLAPRALVLPGYEAEPEDAPAPRAEEEPRDLEEDSPTDSGDLSERMLEAAEAAIPSDLLEQLQLPAALVARSRSAGKSGSLERGGARGRPAGVSAGDPSAEARLNVIETLRAAAPWQRLRAAEASAEGAGSARRIRVRRSDFRVTRFERRTATTTIFVVDASGSTALRRLAEAKGAVELLLAQCYVRRDRVALLAFRGQGAEQLLAPTRSLVRAKRALSSLRGGGSTPLAAGIERASRLAEAVAREGSTPILLFLTDGSANVARDGTAGRARAHQDATQAAQLLRESAFSSLVVDTSPRPREVASEIAHHMGARYLPLPHADASALCREVQDAAPARHTRATARV